VVGVFVVVKSIQGNNPAYPDAWDSRVAPIASWVEQQRGLGFKHPVYVEFLSDSEFADEVTVDQGELSDADQAQADQSAGYYRALGLAGGDLDLQQEQNEADAGGILAFYDPVRQRVFARQPMGESPTLPVDLRVTLAHELTHVLQDQHFDLDAIGDVDGDPTLAFTTRTMVEGDASRVEQAYAAQLSPQDAADYQDVLDSNAATFDELSGEVPLALLAFQQAPYALGQSFLDLIVAAEDESAVDDAIQDPPHTEEPLFDPFLYLDPDTQRALPAPDVADNERLLEEGDFGSTSWYLMLAARLDPHRALAAVDGWAGDSYATAVRKSDDQVCVRLRFAGDTEADLQEMVDALRAWSDAFPGNEATIAPTDEWVDVRTCDPGPDVEIAVDEHLVDALALPALRSWAGAAVLVSSDDVDDEAARCAANELAASIDVATLATNEPLSEEEFARQSAEALAQC
jgi:hypothetical protein